MKSFVLALALATAGCVSPAPQVSADVVIRGGTVYPGGGDPFVGDVAIRGDRVVAVGRSLYLQAARKIDARGLIVSPGFIDPHTHMTEWLTSDDPRRRLIEPFLRQGVTTAFVGNDGGGPVEIGKLLGSAATRPVGLNYAAFTGFGTIRQMTMGSARRAPAGGEIDREIGLVRTAMCEGALGLSTGLFYAPQSFSQTAEVVALAREAARLGGVYDTHLRDEADYTVGLDAAVDEAVAIAREARIPVHISHIKALGPAVQGAGPRIVERIDRARATGLEITAGQYPWDASGTSLVAALVPLWAQDGGRAAMLARLADPALARRLREEISANLARRGGASRLLVVEGRWKGRRLDAIARAMGSEPIDAAIAAIREADAATISFNMSESDIEAFMRARWTMTDSDASTAHPRVWGSFARKFAVYVRERRVLTVREFIDRSSTLTADWFGLEGRGRIRPGAIADIVVFDPATFAATATYDAPERPAIGVRAVLVAGQVAVDGDGLTGVAAGRAIAGAPPAGACQ